VRDLSTPAAAKHSEDADLEEIFDLWGPTIRKWLGHAAFARIRATAPISRGASDRWMGRKNNGS
jgi:hypothetical protein